MKKQALHINFKSLALAILLFFAFGTKEMHHFFEHAHEEVKICDAQQGEHHIHNQEYIGDDCSLCDFTFSVFDFHLPKIHLTHIEEVPFTETNFSTPTFVVTRTHFYKSLRGPPSASLA